MTKLFVDLPRGVTLRVGRPEGWRGEWFVRASWKTDDDQDWQGHYVYSTAGESLTFPPLKKGLWRLQRRPTSEWSADPLENVIRLDEEETLIR